MDSFVITSTPLWSNLSAKNLLDFNLNTPFYTIEEKFAWLIVDMQVMQKISFVILYMKNNAQATNTPWVRIGSRYLYQAPGGTAFMANNSLCAENVTRVGTIITYNCMKILYGRYLSVQSNDNSSSSNLTIMDMTIGFTQDRKRHFDTIITTV